MLIVSSRSPAVAAATLLASCHLPISSVGWSLGWPSLVVVVVVGLRGDLDHLFPFIRLIIRLREVCLFSPLLPPSWDFLYLFRRWGFRSKGWHFMFDGRFVLYVVFFPLCFYIPSSQNSSNSGINFHPTSRMREWSYLLFGQLLARKLWMFAKNKPINHHQQS